MIFSNTYKPIIALLTDFGNKDWYVSTLKAIILNLNENANIVDITHNVQSHSIERASFVLKSSYKFFPKGTIFTCIVDPGVGSERKSIIFTTDEYCFVSPDNALLSYVFNENKGEIYEISNKDFFYKKEISSTFHGRDIYAPVSAYLSKGIPPFEFGEKLENIKLFNTNFNHENGTTIKCKVIYIDKFGNVFLSIEKKDKNKLEDKKISLLKDNKIICENLEIKKTFSNVHINEPIIYFGSEDYLEIAINQGSAEKYFSLQINNFIDLQIQN